jgi:hypothetical protein
MCSSSWIVEHQWWPQVRYRRAALVGILLQETPVTTKLHGGHHSARISTTRPTSSWGSKFLKTMRVQYFVVDVFDVVVRQFQKPLDIGSRKPLDLMFSKIEVRCIRKRWTQKSSGSDVCKKRRGATFFENIVLAHMLSLMLGSDILKNCWHRFSENFGIRCFIKPLRFDVFENVRIEIIGVWRFKKLQVQHFPKMLYCRGSTFSVDVFNVEVQHF